MKPEILENCIRKDIDAGYAPFLIVGTAGTTGAGAIDPLPELARIARRFELWFHVDAAYGGAAVLQPELKPHLKRIEAADSITFDAHKWLSVPMGTSMLLTRHTDVLSRSFGMTAEYMPKEGKKLATTDPFTHSIQWSRRSLGIRLFLPWLIFGKQGFEKVIHR